MKISALLAVLLALLVVPVAASGSESTASAAAGRIPEADAVRA